MNLHVIWIDLSNSFFLHRFHLAPSLKFLSYGLITGDKTNNEKGYMERACDQNFNKEIGMSQKS